MEGDYRRSIKRIEDSENAREKALGAGLTIQGQAIADRELASLTDLITADFEDGRRSRAAREALPMKPRAIAQRLLEAGISLSLSSHYGTRPKDGKKTYIDQALWIAANFGLWGEVGYRVGDWGLRLLDRLDRFELVKGGRGEDRLCLVVTDDLEGLLKATIHNAAEHNPLLKPLPYRPRRWTGFRTGCLSPEHWAKVALVRTNYESTENAITDLIANGQMQPVLDAVSFLQDLPFVINRPVLDLVKRIGPPAAPTDDEINRKIKLKKARRKNLTKNAIRAEIENEHNAEVRDWHLDMAIADWGADRDRLRVGLKLDFRGRLIPICGLSVYRSDRVRALFQFADGEIITEDGVRWLKQFVARLADGNKWSDEPKPSRLDLDGRVAWTNKHLAHLVDIGSTVHNGGMPQLTIDGKTIDPLHGIDDRFQFAAACAELARMIEAHSNGRDFITRLPIQFDASCSGLQHLCAMVSAEEGRYVNLAPSPQKHYETDIDGNVVKLGSPDIYTLIAREVALIEPAFGNHKENLQRKAVKQPIMTMVYGAGIGRQAKQIEAILPGANGRKLAESIRVVLKQIAPKAMALFEWIERLTEECSKPEHNVPLRFTTATGFLVIGNYYWSKTKKIKTPTRNPKYFRNCNFAIGYTSRVKAYKADIAAAANVVHAVDGCLLQMVANVCAELGIPLLTIHDCFSTLANHAGRLKPILNEQFIKCHEYEWLDALCQPALMSLPQSANLPPIPARGTLKIAPNFHAFS